MTSKTMRAILAQDQEALAARHNGTEEPPPKSAWVIARLRRNLPPHHVALAERLIDLRAQSLGFATAEGQFIDGGENGSEIAAGHRCDALRTLYGYEAAVRSRIGHSAAGRCFWAIANAQTYADAADAAGYRDGRGSYRALFVKLVQLVMLAADEYADEIAAKQNLRR